MRYVLVPGRHPDLSRAELAAVLERDGLVTTVAMAGTEAIVLESRQALPPDFPAGLGGMVKWGEVVGESSVADEQVIKIATELLVGLARVSPRGKFEFGLSFYDHTTHKTQQETRLGLTIKKNLKIAGIASRWVQSKERTLSSVVVKMNHLTDGGAELCFFPHDGRYMIARTLAVQAFDEFSFRDYGRPARDIRSGMIPVKLARMMINLSRTRRDGTLLDPFCGSGTILTEAAMMGFREVIGNDLEDKAIEDSAENVAWVREQAIRSRGTSTRLFQGPAEKIDLTLRGIVADGIATEPYLGPPLRGGESLSAIMKIATDLSKVYTQSFAAFSKILRPGGHVAIVFPVFRRGKSDVRIDILDDLKQLGFKSLSLRAERSNLEVASSLPSVAPRNDALLYSRPDQRVAREVWVFRYATGY